MHVLKKHAHCACCGELMAAGEPFRWEEKQAASGSKVGSFRTVHRPAHTDRYCGARKFESERLRSEITGLEQTIVTVSAMPGCEAVVEVLRGRIVEAEAKLAVIASW